MELEETKDIVLLSNAIERVKAPQTVANSSSGRISHEVLVRPSDTNANRIVSSHRLMQYFEDSFSTTKSPDVIYIETLGEIKAKTRCEVVGVPNSDNGGQEIISFLFERDTGSTMARAYVSWASKALKNA